MLRRRAETLFDGVVQGATSFATGLLSEEIAPADRVSFQVLTNVLTSGGTPEINLQVEHSIDGRLWAALNASAEIFRASLSTTAVTVSSASVDLAAAGPRVRARVWSNTGDVLFTRVLVHGRGKAVAIASARAAALAAARARTPDPTARARPEQPTKTGCRKTDCGCGGSCGAGSGKTVPRIPGGRLDVTPGLPKGATLYSGGKLKPTFHPTGGADISQFCKCGWNPILNQCGATEANGQCCECGENFATGKCIGKTKYGLCANLFLGPFAPPPDNRTGGDTPWGTWQCDCGSANDPCTPENPGFTLNTLCMGQSPQSGTCGSCLACVAEDRVTRLAACHCQPSLFGASQPSECPAAVIAFDGVVGATSPCYAAANAPCPGVLDGGDAETCVLSYSDCRKVQSEQVCAAVLAACLGVP